MVGTTANATRLVMAVACCLVALAAAGTVEVASKPSHVTVFRDAAQVTRHAVVELEEGEHALVFGKLPPTVDHRTVQVSAYGTKALLKGVQVQQRPLPRPDTTAEIAMLEARAEAFTAVLQELKDEIARHNGHKTLLQRMATKMEQCGKEPEDISLQKWEEFIAFFGRSHATADSALRLAGDYKRGNETALAAIRAELELLNEQRSRQVVTEHTARVIVVVERAGAVQLNLSYVVSDASWQPVYDLRVEQQPEKKAVTVEFNAVVSQRTGEDWEDVTVELSTASPSRQGVQPEMEPLRLKLLDNRPQPTMHYGGPQLQQQTSNYFPVPRSKRKAARAEQMFSKSMGVKESAVLMEAEDEAEVAPDLPEAMASMSASVSAQGTAVAFTVAGRHTILGGSDLSPYNFYAIRRNGEQPRRRPEPVRVPVAHETLPAVFRYSAVPKLEQRAYLKARLTAPKAYPLLAGAASVFTDQNRFTASTTLDFVPAGEDFWVFLGADDDVRVSHKLLKRVEQDEGGFLSGKRRRVEYRYLIEVRNGKSTREEVVVWDQLPVVEDKDITVEVVEHGDAPMKRNELEYVEWMLDLAPKQQKKIPFTFHVDYPKDKWVQGLP